MSIEAANVKAVSLLSALPGNLYNVHHIDTDMTSLMCNNSRK